MKWLAVALVALVSGCGTTGGAYSVAVPVPVECKEPVPARPAMPTDGLRSGGALFLSVITMQAEIELREGYEKQLRTALEACTRPLNPSNLPPK